MRFKSIGLILVLALTGCSSVPIAGPINPGLEVSAANSLGEPTAIPQSPRIGMSKIEIAAGFFQANFSPIGDYAVARQYLDNLSSFEWNPYAQTSVIESTFKLEELNPNLVTASAELVLALDDQLRIISGQNQKSLKIDLYFVQVNGEWRIANPPSGVVLIKTEFQRSFKVKTTWFVDKSFNRLVPDFVAVGARSDSATQLIRSLIQGSSSWLRPAVVNLLDPSITGSIPTLQRIGEKVIVDFDAEVLKLDQRRQSLLFAQLSQTLQGISGVSELEVSVGGQRWRLPGISNPMNLNFGQWPERRSLQDSNLFGVNAVNQLFLTNSKLDVVSWLNSVGEISSFAIANDERNIAIHSKSNSRILYGDRAGNPRAIDGVAQSTSLNFDQDGNLWFFNPDNRGLFLIENNQVKRVNLVNDLSSTVVNAIIGPDLIRVVLVTENNQSSSLQITRLVKTSTTLVLKDPVVITTVAGQISALDWLSNTQIIALVKFPNQGETIGLLVDLATGDQTILRLPSSVKTMSTNSAGLISLVDDQGFLWRRSNLGWEELGNASMAAFPKQ